jgi:predicted phage terminase large subunit-like protein
MTPEQFEDFCATIATLRSGTERRQKYLNELHRTSDFTVDPIVAISYAGEEEVFDVQIERTENFIANGVVSHNTRWSQLDLTGMLLEYQANNPDADQWEVIELPAILEVKNEKTGEVVEKSLWPEKWPLEELQLARASMDPRYWNAQYMQNPTSDAVAVIKREQWREWPTTRPPHCDFILQTWDTAFEAKTTSDFSACTTWGIFTNEDENNESQVILLDAFKDRMEFPDLKAYVKKHYDEWEPDVLMVEKKASGAPLIYELRTMGIPVSEYTPHRGTGDKMTRLNAISDLFASGKVWAPPTRWARDVIEEVASFPVAAHDDYVDCVSMAMLRVRQGGFIRTNLDEPDDVSYFKSSRKAAYY